MNAVSRRYDNIFKKRGINLIAGVDEVGIGPLAGPVVAAAVILEDGSKIKGLDDSKKLSPKEREELLNIIVDSSVSVGVGIIDSAEIDLINILQASLKAMASAVNSLSKRPNHILVDGIRTIPNISIAQTAVKHGDGSSYSIAAASVVAKVVRDRIMDNYDHVYPQYGFADHKGYGTEEHISMINKFGPTSIHRMTFQPVFEALQSKGLLFMLP